ncbi:hydrogenase isoenzymes formation protein HypC [bacterium BMS3Abin01]|nr:hydrogenase isoenzymes formation protein HypC [bacterium BMS3Abin01]HDY69351.1 HypC/HybG/HupF family hydrogenase formation chaperone [Actinomycetota bacterium]
MCLAVPAKITEMENQIATVQVGGLSRQASTVLLPDAAVGDYVLIHAGFAISLIDEEQALETIRLFDEMTGGMASGGGGA